MMSAHTQIHVFNNNNKFTFFSNPPPPPSPSNAYSNIITWASLVQPGSPAPPSSARSSFNHRQKSPSSPDFDLTALGYTSVFVHLPKTPTTPSPYLRQRSATSKPPIPPMPSEQQSQKRTGLSRFRSLSILRPRSSKQPSSTLPPPLPKINHIKSKHSPPTDNSSATIAKRKRAKYAVPPPPPLANELALMQFMEGGNIDSHAKRVMQAQAKAASRPGLDNGVADVYRDGNGGIWWDADEEWEYTHLLADAGAATAPIPPPGKLSDAMVIDWEDFGAAEPCYDSFFTNLQLDKENNPLTIDRRDSVSSQDSDLDPKYLLTVPEHTPSGFNAPVEDRVLASRKIGGPGMSILSLPSRPTRKALHLNKAEFLVDLAAFGPRSPKSNVATTGPTKPKPKGQARRRPAPLKLAHQPQNAVVVVRRPAAAQPKTPALDTVETVRREFIADSFAPIPNATKSVTSPPPQPVMNRKPSKLNIRRGLFGRRGD